MKAMYAAAFCAASLVAASSASAASYSYAFADAGGTYNLAGGNVLTLTAYTYEETDTTPAELTNMSAALLDDTGPGIGVRQEGKKENEIGNPQIDSKNNEIVMFSFTLPVKITAISFVNDDTNDHVDLVFGSTITFNDLLSSLVDSSLASYNGLTGPYSVFGIGTNYKNSDQFRLAGFTYSWGGDGNTGDPGVVPLPATGLLLLGGLGGLAALRKRRKSA